MRIFLTGGTGFIGHPLTRALSGRGWEVTVLVRRPESDEASEIRAMGGRLVQGDVTDRESIWSGSWAWAFEAWCRPGSIRWQSSAPRQQDGSGANRMLFPTPATRKRAPRCGGPRGAGHGSF